MKHTHKKIQRHATQHRAHIITLTSIACAFVFLSGVFLFTRGTNPATAELAFTERSVNATGSVIPASGESGCTSGSEDCQAGIGAVTVTWTSYCTENDPNNPWEIWEYSDENPPSYREVGTDSSCQPSCENGGITGAACCTSSQTWNGSACVTNSTQTATVTWTSYCTGGSDPNNPWEIWEYSDENPPSYREVGTDSSCQPSCENGWLTGQQCCTGTDIWDVNSASCQPFWYDPDIFAPTPSGCGPGTLNDTCPDPAETETEVVVDETPEEPTPSYSPEIINVSLTGNNTSSGTLSFQCNNSTLYSIVRNEGSTGQFPITNQTYPGGSGVSVTVTAEGNYRMTCSDSSQSDSETRAYTTPGMSLSDLFVSANPRTVNNNKNTTLSWSVLNPENSCSLRAEVVCAGGHASCSAEQLAEEDSFNSTFVNGKTDANDPYGASRNIQNAVRKVAPQNNPTGNKALGKKTLLMNNTTDFILDCGSSVLKKIRVVVSNENEG